MLRPLLHKYWHKIHFLLPTIICKYVSEMPVEAKREEKCQVICLFSQPWVKTVPFEKLFYVNILL